MSRDNIGLLCGITTDEKGIINSTENIMDLAICLSILDLSKTLERI